MEQQIKLQSVREWLRLYEETYQLLHGDKDMNINEAFPSKFLKAADLEGKKIKLQIDRISMENFDDDAKPTAYFVGKEKGMVLNKTNSMILGAEYGPETDNWVGKSISLYSKKVSYNGSMVDSLAVEPFKEVSETDAQF